MGGSKAARTLKPAEHDRLLGTLAARFETNRFGRANIRWGKLRERLEAVPEKLWALNEMERTGGEPDMVGCDEATGQCVFFDCSAESPGGRRSVCYDRAGLGSRKAHKPENNAVDTAADMGIEILDERQYRELQKFGDFDTKTSSWLATPGDIRKSGGAIFGDRRYGRVFVYHNGAQSCFGARGFRGVLRV